MLGFLFTDSPTEQHSRGLEVFTLTGFLKQQDFVFCRLDILDAGQVPRITSLMPEGWHAARVECRVFRDGSFKSSVIPGH